MQQKLQDLIKEQFKLKMQHGSGQLPKNHLLRKVRKDIARQKTLIHQSQLALGASK